MVPIRNQQTRHDPRYAPGIGEKKAVPSPALGQLGLICSSVLTEQGDSRCPRGATGQLKAR
jgi:hypothetical protein